MSTLFRFDGWTRTALGPAVARATVYVCTQPAVTTVVPPSPLAQVYADPLGLQPITQPILTDGLGHYDFYVAAGTYTIVVASGTPSRQVYPDQTIGFNFETSVVTSLSGDGTIFSNSNSTGAVTLQLVPQGPNSVLAGPIGGGSGIPSFRNLVVSDIPALPAYLLLTGGQVTGPLTLSGALRDSSNSPGSSGQILTSTGSGVAWATISGTGTVTSVAFAGDGVVLSSTPTSPVTSSGTLSATLLSQNANAVLAGPTSGSAAAPTFRSLVVADLPSGIPNSYLSNSSLSVAGDGTVLSSTPVSIALGSSGALSLLNQSANKVLAGPTSGVATAPTFRSLVVADLPTSIPNANLQNAAVTITGDGTVFSNTTPGAVALGSSGSLALKTQSANLVFAGPSSGSAAAPTFRSLVSADMPGSRTGAIQFTIDGGGSTPSTGNKGYIEVPTGFTITSVVLTADQSGSCVLGISTSSYSGFPGSLTSIVASDPPTLSSAQKSSDSSLTGWTTSIPAGNILAFSVTSASTLTRINVTLNGNITSW